MTTRFIGVDQLMMRDDGRTVEGRIVPYNEVARVVQRNPDTGEIESFQEQFLQGSLARLAQAAQARGNAGFIAFKLDHEDPSLEMNIGYAKEIRDEKDGAWASFRLYESKDIDKVRSMLRESHTGLSVNFADIKPPKEIDGVISRVQVVINHVAATPTPTYVGAGISAMRSETGVMLAGTPELERVKVMLAELKGVKV